MSAGELRERIGFYQRENVSDGYGNNEAGYSATAEFVVAAKVEPKLGGETVLAARLTGKNFDNITVRYSSDTAQVTTDWQAKDERSGQLYNIRSVINPDKRKRYLEILCEKGVAV